SPGKGLAERLAPSFHAQLSVAPLKQFEKRQAIPTGESFHAQLSVAPLKHTMPRAVSSRLTLFPRSAERVSIEAERGLTRLSARAGMFPRSAERGSIEA